MVKLVEERKLSVYDSEGEDVGYYSIATMEDLGYTKDEISAAGFTDDDYAAKQTNENLAAEQEFDAKVNIQVAKTDLPGLMNDGNPAEAEKRLDEAQNLQSNEKSVFTDSFKYLTAQEMADADYSEAEINSNFTAEEIQASADNASKIEFIEKSIDTMDNAMSYSKAKELLSSADDVSNGKFNNFDAETGIYVQGQNIGDNASYFHVYEDPNTGETLINAVSQDQFKREIMENTADIVSKNNGQVWGKENLNGLVTTIPVGASYALPAAASDADLKSSMQEAMDNARQLLGDGGKMSGLDEGTGFLVEHNERIYHVTANEQGEVSYKQEEPNGLIESAALRQSQELSRAGVDTNNLSNLGNRIDNLVTSKPDDMSLDTKIIGSSDIEDIIRGNGPEIVAVTAEDSPKIEQAIKVEALAMALEEREAAATVINSPSLDELKAQAIEQFKNSDDPKVQSALNALNGTEARTQMYGLKDLSYFAGKEGNAALQEGLLRKTIEIGLENPGANEIMIYQAGEDLQTVTNGDYQNKFSNVAHLEANAKANANANANVTPSPEEGKITTKTTDDSKLNEETTENEVTSTPQKVDLSAPISPAANNDLSNIYKEISIFHYGQHRSQPSISPDMDKDTGVYLKHNGDTYLVTGYQGNPNIERVDPNKLDKAALKQTDRSIAAMNSKVIVGLNSEVTLDTGQKNVENEHLAKLNMEYFQISRNLEEQGDEIDKQTGIYMQHEGKIYLAHIDKGSLKFKEADINNLDPNVLEQNYVAQNAQEHLGSNQEHVASINIEPSENMNNMAINFNDSLSKTECETQTPDNDPTKTPISTPTACV